MTSQKVSYTGSKIAIVWKPSIEKQVVNNEQEAGVKVLVESILPC